MLEEKLGSAVHLVNPKSSSSPLHTCNFGAHFGGSNRLQDPLFAPLKEPRPASSLLHPHQHSTMSSGLPNVHIYTGTHQSRDGAPRPPRAQHNPASKQLQHPQPLLDAWGCTRPAHRLAFGGSFYSFAKVRTQERAMSHPQIPPNSSSWGQEHPLPPGLRLFSLFTRTQEPQPRRKEKEKNPSGFCTFLLASGLAMEPNNSNTITRTKQNFPQLFNHQNRNARPGAGDRAGRPASPLPRDPPAQGPPSFAGTAKAALTCAEGSCSRCCPASPLAHTMPAAPEGLCGAPRGLQGRAHPAAANPGAFLRPRKTPGAKPRAQPLLHTCAPSPPPRPPGWGQSPAPPAPAAPFFLVFLLFFRCAHTPQLFRWSAAPVCTAAAPRPSSPALSGYTSVPPFLAQAP